MGKNNGNGNPVKQAPEQDDSIIKALEQWDSGDTVWVISLGGLGPGYEQAIYMLAFELLRGFLRFRGNETALQRFMSHDKNGRKKRVDRIIDKVNKWPGGGFTGAQVGQSRHFAFVCLAYGYEHMMKKARTEIPDRVIQVSKSWTKKPDKVNPDDQ